MGAADDLERRLSMDEVIVLDGGVGTELQARGVAMDDAIWCGAANLRHPEAVQQMHEAYIQAGADVITTNTFACNRAALESCGLGEAVQQANRNAVLAAVRARDAVADTSVVIAGSISPLCSLTMRKTTIDATGEGSLDEDDLRPSPEHFREQASILAEAGVDLIALEMMNAPGYGVPAVEAALATGLPVWLGVSPRRLPDGSLGTVQDVPSDQPSFERLISILADKRLAAINIMHAKMSAVTDAIRILQGYFDGTIGVYPESGDWAPPNWVFTDVSPAEYVAAAKLWVGRGARIVGGCCGIRPAHIRAVSAELRGTQ